MAEYYLVIFREEEQYGWFCALDEEDREHLQREVQMYNEWCELLTRGRAPTSCYDGSDIADQLLKAQHTDYQDFFGRPTNRNWYERDTIIFDLVPVAETEDNLDILTSLELTDLITDPYGSCRGLGLGYRVLPVLEYLINR